MRTFFSLLLIIVKLYIFCKITYLLYMTNADPINYPIDSLTWWIYLLVFDIWLQFVLPNNEDIDTNESK
jgi:hypothetical protein